MVKCAVLAIGLGVAGIAGCTLYALSDKVSEMPCTWSIEDRKVRDNCDELNDRGAPDFNRCEPWQCNPKHHCEKLRLDQDRDGFPPSACLSTSTTERGDCDDVDSEVHPDRTEICDGKDNDCDHSFDEGMLLVDERVVLVFDDTVRELAYASDDFTEGLVGVVYRTGDEGAAGFAILTPAAGIGTAMPVHLSASGDVLRASAVNVTAHAGHFVMSAIEAAAPRRLWIGDVSIGGERGTLNINDPNMRHFGLRCAKGEPCETQPMELAKDEVPAGEPPQIPGTIRPELAMLGTQVRGTQVLAGYARKLDPAADGCDVTSPTPPMLLNLLDQTSAGYSERTPAAIVLDRSGELRSPRLLPIDASAVTASREPFGWLAAYLDTTEGLVIRRVRPQGDDALTDLQLRLQRDPEPYLEVQLMQGEVRDNRFVIGVAARAGCGDRARVVFGLVQLTWDATGRNELRVYRELHEVGEPGQQASRPVVAYNRMNGDWGVAYSTPDGMFARVLDSNGQSIGDRSYRLSDALPPVPDVSIVPGGRDDSGLFTIYSYAEQPDQSPSHVLIARELRVCAKTTVTTLIEGN